MHPQQKPDLVFFNRRPYVSHGTGQTWPAPSLFKITTVGAGNGKEIMFGVTTCLSQIYTVQLQILGGSGERKTVDSLYLMPPSQTSRTPHRRFETGNRVDPEELELNSKTCPGGVGAATLQRGCRGGAGNGLCESV